MEPLFVARLDTALRVVWRTLLPAPTAAGPADPAADVQPGQVRLRAGGGFAVMAAEQFTNGHPRLRPSEFSLVHLNAQGRVLGWDTYCSKVCTLVAPTAWQYLLADSSVVVSGSGQQRDATGRLLAQPAWLARFTQACRHYTAPFVPTASTGPSRPPAGLQLYPLPAHAGQAVQVVWARPADVAGPWALRVVDLLGRTVAQTP